MATRYEYDVFISYHQADNYDSWVTAFHEELENRLSAILGTKVRIWRDPKLSRIGSYADEILERLKKSATLLLIFTPGWWQSPECQKELAEFQQMAATNGGIKVDLKLRIIKAVMLPLKASGYSGDHDPVLPEALGFKFYKSDDQSRFREFDRDTKDFKDSINTLAFEIRDILLEIRRAEGQPSPPSPPVPHRANPGTNLNLLASPSDAPILLYSTNNWLSFKIAEKYYKSEHRVWCSPVLGNRRDQPSIDDPFTSYNPFDIYTSLLTESRRGDPPSGIIVDEKLIIIREAAEKRKTGKISKEADDEISTIVGAAKAHHFRPLIYVIPYVLVAEQVKITSSPRGNIAGEASLSETFLIEKLHRRCFHVIEYLEKFGGA